MLDHNKSLKPKVSVENLGIYLKTISQKYPDVKKSDALATKISSEFGVVCTSEDIRGYAALHIQHEDYELESRRQEYGIVM